MAKNPFDVLGVRQGATQDEIKKAYRTMVKKYHPDNYTDHPLADLAKEKMQEVNEAYDRLTNGNAANGPYAGQSGNPGQPGANQQNAQQQWQQWQQQQQRPYGSQGPYYRNTNGDLCNTLSCMCCADSCCECCGSDLISCC
ncbi:MAG: J domain-containing protein [Eubacteriales bacterium]|nr:J domain-containing protein [Eubacteriales bacterium]